MRMPSLFVLVSILVMQQCLPVNGYYFNHHPTPRTGRHKHHPQASFSHLEKLLNRLESSAEARPRSHDVATLALSTPEPTTSASPLRSVSHSHWKSYNPPRETYEDEDFDTEDDEEEEFDDDEEEEDDEETLDDQYSQSDDHGSRWDIPQSEPRYRPQPSMSPISQSKWDTMGSRKGVDELRNKMNGEYSPHQHKYDMKKVADHMVRINRDGDCKVPRPKLVQVKDEYPHPSKSYMPRCTILHQCGDDSGCCKAESLTCVPRHSSRVELFFYTTTVGPSGTPSTGRVERLIFYNHTECKCEDRNSGIMPRDVETGHYFRRSTSYGSGSIFRKQDRSYPEPERPETKISSCQCPSKYTIRRSRNGGCSCDCFDKQRDCLRMKKGKEYFSPQDRLCIQKEECKFPTCEFGSYLRLAGRCPKKPERFEAWKH